MSILFLSLPLAGIVLYCTTISAIENIHNNKSCYSNKVLGSILFAYIIFVSIGIVMS